MGEERGRRNPRTVAEARLGMTETTTLWIEEKKRGKFWFFVFFLFLLVRCEMGFLFCLT